MCDSLLIKLRRGGGHPMGKTLNLHQKLLPYKYLKLAVRKINLDPGGFPQQIMKKM